MTHLRQLALAAALFAASVPAFAADGFTVTGALAPNGISIDTQSSGYSNSSATTVLGQTVTASQVVVPAAVGVTGSVTAYETTVTTSATTTTETWSLDGSFTSPTKSTTSAFYSGTVSGTGSFTLLASATSTGVPATVDLVDVTLLSVPTLYYSVNGGSLRLLSASTATTTDTSYSLTGETTFNLTAGNPITFRIGAIGRDGAAIETLHISLSGALGTTTSTTTSTQVVGTYTIPALPAVPEPGVATLAGLAFGAVSLVRRRQARAA